MSWHYVRVYRLVTQLVIVALLVGPLSAPAHVMAAVRVHKGADLSADNTSALTFSISQGNDTTLSVRESDADQDRAGPEGIAPPEIDRPNTNPVPQAAIGPSTWPTLTCEGWWWCDPATDAFPMAVVSTMGSSYCSVGEWSNLSGILGTEDESAARLVAGACGGYYQVHIGSIVVDFGKVFTDSGTSHSLIGNIYVEDSNSLYEVRYSTSLDGQTWDWSRYNTWGNVGGWLEFGTNHAEFKIDNSTDVPPFRYVKLELQGREVNGSGIHTYYLGALRISGGGTPVEEGLNGHNDQCYTSPCPVPAGCFSQNEVGRPINTRTGHYYYQRTDLSIPALGEPLRFQRTYIAHTTGVITGAAVYSMPLGYGWTHNYNARLAFSGTVGGEPDTVIYQAPGGSRLRFQDSGGGTYTPYPGIKGTLTRTASSPYSYTLTAPGQQAYVFDDAGKLVTQRDAKGNTTQLTYDGSGRLERVTEPLGQRYLDLDYDVSGRLIQVEDPLNRTVGYGYDASGDLVVVTDTRGYTWTYAYTSAHLLEAAYDPDGDLLEGQGYDDQGRVVTQTDALGHELMISYGNSGERTITDESGRKTIDHYGPKGTLVGQVDGVGGAPSYAYNDDFNKVSSVDEMGRTTSYEWSDCGCAVEVITDALGCTTTMTYDDRNNLTSVTNAQGHTVIGHIV